MLDRNRRTLASIALAGLLAVTGVTQAQTTDPSNGVDVEIYNPVDGSNAFCAAPAETLWAHVLVRPGNGSSTCDLGCGSVVDGGSAHLATAVVDVAFDPSVLSYLAAVSNPSTAAQDGLIQDHHAAQGRVGWALAGDWITNGNPTSGLKNPCNMMLLDTSAWVVQLQFAATAQGRSSLHLRTPGDSTPFPLSFADICGTPAFTLASGGIDEVRGAEVLVSSECAESLFFDGFEVGTTGRWSATVP